MINVDFASPSLVLGAGLITTGVILLQMRNLQTQTSRDADIVVAAMVSIVGSTLIFQGWRLDPLLLLCQALTISVAFWYGLEAFRLRGKANADQPQAMLPPPDAAPQEDYRSYYSQAPQQQQQQQQGQFPGPPEQGAYPWAGPQGQQQLDPAGVPPSRWGLPPPSTTTAGRPFADTISYDYYGNPLEVPVYDAQYSQQYEQYAAGPIVDPYAGGPAAAYGAAPPQSPNTPMPSGQPAYYDQQYTGAGPYGQYGEPSYSAEAPQQPGYYGAAEPSQAAPSQAAAAGYGQPPWDAAQQGFSPAAGEQQPLAPPVPVSGGAMPGRGPAAVRGPVAATVFEPVDDWE